MYKNDQWEVTNYGLESVTPGAPYVYQIPKETLLKIENGSYGWVVHLAEKTWIKYPLFVDAFEEAANYHFPGSLDAQVFLDSQVEAKSCHPHI